MQQSEAERKWQGGGDEWDLCGGTCVVAPVTHSIPSYIFFHHRRIKPLGRCAHVNRDTSLPEAYSSLNFSGNLVE